MKIAMFIEAWHPIWWWGQAVAENLAKYLSEKQNCKVDLYVMNLSWKTNNYKEKINNNFHIVYVWKKRNFGFIDRIFWCIDLVKLVKKSHNSEQYSHIFAHANLPWVPAKILSKQLNVACIYQVHGSWLEAMEKMYGNNLKSKILFFIENYFQTKIQYDLQISVDKKFLERKNINSAIFIPNWVNIQKYDEIQNIEKENKNWLNFIFVWRLHPQKWLIFLIEAVKKIKHTLKNEKFIIIWEWEEENHLKSKITEYKIDHFFDFRWKKSWNELIKEFKKADVFVLPSLFEWFPLTLLEAWASKLPVLVTDVWENSEIIRSGRNWFISKNWNSGDLAKNIENITKISKNNLIKIWNNWYELVNENYDLDSINLKVFNNIKNING